MDLNEFKKLVVGDKIQNNEEDFEEVIFVKDGKWSYPEGCTISDNQPDITGEGVHIYFPADDIGKPIEVFAQEGDVEYFEKIS